MDAAPNGGWAWRRRCEAPNRSAGRKQCTSASRNSFSLVCVSCSSISAGQFTLDHEVRVGSGCVLGDTSRHARLGHRSPSIRRSVALDASVAPRPWVLVSTRGMTAMVNVRCNPQGLCRLSRLHSPTVPVQSFSGRRCPGVSRDAGRFHRNLDREHVTASGNQLDHLAPMSLSAARSSRMYWNRLSSATFTFGQIALQQVPLLRTRPA